MIRFPFCIMFILYYDVMTDFSKLNPVAVLCTFFESSICYKYVSDHHRVHLGKAYPP